MHGAPELYPVLIPLIRHSTNVSSSESVHTLDEGLNLWHKTVHRAPACTEELCSLFPTILVTVAAKDISPPIAKTLCRLSEDYLLLLMAAPSATLALDSVFSTTVQLLDMLMTQGNTGTPALRTLLLVTQLLPTVTGGQLPGPPLSDTLNALLERILFRVVVFTSQVRERLWSYMQDTSFFSFFIFRSGNRHYARVFPECLCATCAAHAPLFRSLLCPNGSQITRKRITLTITHSLDRQGEERKKR